jgi:hypothetical protein
MSRHVSLAAFFATVLVIVPAGWHALDATIAADGPATRPKQHTLHTGDAAVTVDLDRGVMMAGGKLKVTLVGTADKAHEISLDVRALKDNGMGEERVANPPTVVGKRRITIDAAPGGGKPTEVTFELGSMKRKGVVQWYDVDVKPVGVKADDLAYDDTETEDGTPMRANAAKVGAAVWAGNSFGMTIEPPQTLPAEGPFKVAVRVKNTTRKSIDWVDAELGGPELDYSAMEGLSLYTNAESADFEVTADDRDEEAELAPGKEQVFTYLVTPKPGIRKFTFVANARGGRGGALDVLTVERPTAPEAVQPAVATK